MFTKPVYIQLVYASYKHIALRRLQIVYLYILSQYKTTLFKQIVTLYSLYQLFTQNQIVMETGLEGH